MLNRRGRCGCCPPARPGSVGTLHVAHRHAGLGRSCGCDEVLRAQRAHRDRGEARARVLDVALAPRDHPRARGRSARNVRTASSGATSGRRVPRAPAPPISMNVGARSGRHTKSSTTRPAWPPGTRMTSARRRCRGRRDCICRRHARGMPWSPLRTMSVRSSSPAASSARAARPRRHRRPGTRRGSRRHPRTSGTSGRGSRASCLPARRAPMPQSFAGALIPCGAWWWCRRKVPRLAGFRSARRRRSCRAPARGFPRARRRRSCLSRRGRWPPRRSCSGARPAFSGMLCPPNGWSAGVPGSRPCSSCRCGSRRREQQREGQDGVVPHGP